jgi:hypothetical protein
MRWWKLFKAWFWIDLDAVCEMSKGRGPRDDFHDWTDSVIGKPWHQYRHTCKRCGKVFEI